MKRLAVAFVAGAIFALGLGVSGMTDPSRILGFLDVTGRWDPSLIFVMFGAIAVHFGYHYPQSVRALVLVSAGGLGREVHLLLRAAEQPDRLSPVTRILLDDPQAEPFFSAVSLWEIAIKSGLGRDGITLLTADPLIARYPAPVRRT